MISAFEEATLVTVIVPAFWQSMSTVPETPEKCESKCSKALRQTGIPIHDGLLYLLTGLFIYLPLGIGMRMFSNAGNAKMVEWYYVLGAYLGGFILYLVSGALFYRVRFLMIIIFHLFMIQIYQNDKKYQKSHLALCKNFSAFFESVSLVRGKMREREKIRNTYSKPIMWVSDQKNKFYFIFRTKFFG